MTNSATVQSGKVVLITGASSGIGEATARYLAAHGPNSRTRAGHYVVRAMAQG